MTRRIPQEPPPPNAAEIGRLVLELAALLAPQFRAAAVGADPPRPPDRPYTPETLAQRWGCTPRHVQKLCREDRLGHFKVGRLLRIPPGAVIAFEAEEARHGRSGPDAGRAAAPGASRLPARPDELERQRIQDAIRHARMIAAARKPQREPDRDA